MRHTTIGQAVAKSGSIASAARGAGQGPGRERRVDAGILAKGGLSAFSSCGQGVEDAGSQMGHNAKKSSYSITSVERTLGTPQRYALARKGAYAAPEAEPIATG
jgi:hypothetical protein